MESIELIGEVFRAIFYVAVEFWWLYLPPVLLVVLLKNIETYNRIKYLDSLEWVLLEIRVPREPNKSPKAMEQVFAGLHGVSGGTPKFKDRVFKGKVGDWFSFELAGTAGDVHFYVRTLKQYRDLVESQIYAQYPDVELKEVEDYMNALPAQIPSNDFDIWGAEFVLDQPDALPIRTYPEFEEKGGGPDAAKRIDPMASVAEVLSLLEAGEYIGIQWLIRSPGKDVSKAWTARGQEAIDKLMGKKPKGPDLDPIQKLVFAIDAMIPGGAPAEEKKEEKKEDLTPGKRETIELIEKTYYKLPFEVGLRIVYVGPTSDFHKAHVAALSGALKQFASPARNFFATNPESMPPMKGLFKKSKTFLKKAEVFNNFRTRKFTSKPFVFNTEALATVYHFPDVTVKSPMLPRVETRKGEPPSNLPIN